MNILILLKSFNYPPRNGGDQAVFNAIKKLMFHVHYHIISTDNSTEGQNSVTAFKCDFPEIPILIYDINTLNKYQWIYKKALRISNYINNRNGNKQIVNLQQINMYDARVDYNNAFFQFLNQYIVQQQIDIVQGEFQFTLGWLKGITGKIKKVFVHHEIQFVVEHQRLVQRDHTVNDLYFYEQQRQQEINALNACDAIITLSENDRQKLITAGVHAPIFASFAQISLHNIPISYPINIQKHLVFIGPESHQPNKQGMQWFMDNVFPLIHQQEPETKISIIGRWSIETQQQWTCQYSNIHFLGFVDDLAKTAKECILIVPLFQGSGIRMKILEACNIGIPFVATTIGAEGLGFTDGENCYIEDDKTQFAQKILNLLQNPNTANSFIRKSIAHIRNNFTDEQLVNSRMKCYNSMTNTDTNERKQ